MINLAIAPEIQDFLGVVLLVILGIIHGRTERVGNLPMILWRLPSTIMHEAAHYFTAMALLAGPSGFNLIPQRVEGGGWILGSVTCKRIGIISALPVGLAPLVVNLPLAWVAYQAHTLTGVAWTYIFLSASVPSGQDVKVAISSWIGVGVWGVMAGVVFWLLMQMIGG